MSATSVAFEKVRSQHEKIVNGETKLGPGQPLRFSEAATVDDCLAQGDLYLRIADSVPSNYKKVEGDRHLLPPGQRDTMGAKHALVSLKGIDVYHPPGFEKNYEKLDGPYLVFNQEGTVTHPTHGDITVPAGMTVECFYQREYDEEQKRERRARD